MTHAEYDGRRYVPELDALRAICILIVVTVHAKDARWGFLAGSLGVQVFFVISGYLITMLGLREERARGRLDVPAFFIRRVFRLFPLYYGVLAVYCVIVFCLPGPHDRRTQLAGALPYYLSYFQEYPFFVGIHGSFQNIPYYQSWSLGIEEKFYLVWPFLGFVLWRAKPLGRLAGTVALALAMAAVPALFGWKLGRFFFPYGSIAVGCVAALLLDRPQWFDRLRALGRPAGIWSALAVLLAVHFCRPYLRFPWSAWFDFPYSVLAAIFIVALLTNDGGVIRRALRARWLVLVGRLSYGIYLVHLLAYNVVEKVIHPGSGKLSHAAAIYVLTCLVATALAYGMHRAIELPCIAIGRRVSARLLRRHTGVPPAPVSPA